MVDNVFDAKWSLEDTQDISMSVYDECTACVHVRVCVLYRRYTRQLDMCIHDESTAYVHVHVCVCVCVCVCDQNNWKPSFADLSHPLYAKKKSLH